MSTSLRSVISLRGIGVEQDNLRLHSITLDVPEHSRFALLGPPGSGKSTLVHALAGAVPISTGTGRILSHLLHEPQITRDSAIAFLLRSAPVPSDLSVSDVVHLLARRVPDERIRMQTDELLEQTGLQGRKLVAGDALSARERRLVSLIILHTQSPQVLILDNPTDGLGPNDRRVVLDVIQRISAERTVFFTTAYASDAQHIATHVALLHNGAILTQGRSESIFAWPHTAVYRLGVVGDTRIVFEYVRDLAWVREIIEEKVGEQTVWTIWLNNDMDVPTYLLRAILADRGLKIVEFRQVRPPVDRFFTELDGAMGEPP